MARKKQDSNSALRLEKMLEALKRGDLKLTVPRKSILEVLVNEHGPFTAEEILKQMPRKTCDTATVYRSLTSMEEAGLIHRCEFGDGVARYELREPDTAHHHHHLICRVCKKIDIIDEDEIEEIDKFATKKGYSKVSHILEFFGVCPNCG